MGAPQAPIITFLLIMLYETDMKKRIGYILCALLFGACNSYVTVGDSAKNFYEDCRQKVLQHEWTRISFEYSRAVGLWKETKPMDLILHNTSDSTQTLAILDSDHYVVINNDSLVYVCDRNADIWIAHSGAPEVDVFGCNYYDFHGAIEMSVVSLLGFYAPLIERFSYLKPITDTAMLDYVGKNKPKIATVVTRKVCTPTSCYGYDFPVELIFSVNDSTLVQVNEPSKNGGESRVVKVKSISHDDCRLEVESLLDFSDPKFKDYTVESGDSVYLYSQVRTTVGDTLPSENTNFPFVNIGSGDTVRLDDMRSWKLVYLWSCSKSLSRGNRLAREISDDCDVMLVNPKSDNVIYNRPVVDYLHCAKISYSAKRFGLLFDQTGDDKYYLISPQNIICVRGSFGSARSDGKKLKEIIKGGSINLPYSNKK